MYLMNFSNPYRPGCAATQRMQRVFCPPVAVNAGGLLPGGLPGRVIPPVFARHGGIKKPTGPTGSRRARHPADSRGGIYLRFLRGVGAQKNPLDPLDPSVPAPRPLPVHDLAPEVPRLARCGYPGPRGVRPPWPSCPGTLGSTLRPGGCPALSP